MKTKKAILLILVIVIYQKINAQCTIPNGGFDNWVVGNAPTNPNTYDLPSDWSESIIPNIFSRFSNGTGFFYEYDEADSNGSALVLFRGIPELSSVPINSGFIRFECDNIPNNVTVKLKGRYKFSGSNLENVVDTLTIASYYSTVSDTLTLLDLHLRVLPDRAKKIVITESSETFIAFEIDLSEFTAQNADYATIQLIMKSGSDNQLNTGYSNAVIDDLALVYESILGVDDFSKEKILIYPNPTVDKIYIKNLNNVKIQTVEIFDTLGRLILRKANNTNQEIDLTGKINGVYFLKLYTEENSVYTYKIIKK